VVALKRAILGTLLKCQVSAFGEVWNVAASVVDELRSLSPGFICAGGNTGLPPLLVQILYAAGGNTGLLPLSTGCWFGFDASSVRIFLSRFISFLL